jgi:CRISPR system Cascade subunit CasB
MSEHAESFIDHLHALAERDRGALAHLRRSLGFSPGAYPQAYPYVERFVPADRHARDPWRMALYLTAGLFAFHPEHRAGESLATALGRLARARESTSIEQRFIALLSAEPEILPHMLRQVVSLLAADGLPCDFARLLDDLGVWLRAADPDGRDRLRQRWARDFYRAYDSSSGPAPRANQVSIDNQSAT